MAAICNWCKQKMTYGMATCSGNVEIKFPDGETLAAVPYTTGYGGVEDFCSDCGVNRGGTHHPGCDGERCPRCPKVCGPIYDPVSGSWKRGCYLPQPSFERGQPHKTTCEVKDLPNFQWYGAQLIGCGCLDEPEDEVE